MSGSVCQHRYNQMDFFLRSSWISFWIHSFLGSWWGTFVWGTFNSLLSGTGSTCAEGIPQKFFHQYPCPACGKEERNLTFVVQGQCCFFFTDNGFIVCPFGELKKILRGQSLKFFQKGKQHSTEVNFQKIHFNEHL